jgi:sugar phosphate permease
LAVEDSRRWLMLGLGTAAQTVASTLMFGLPFLLPTLRRTDGLSLAEAGALAAAPSVGLVLTLILWGTLADRYGERAVLATGLTLTGTVALASTTASQPTARGLAFALIGAAGASVNAASGRLVMGWFGVRQRGVAMGVRQMGQPLGVAAAALVMPPLAQTHGLGTALAVPALACLVVALLIAVLARDPAPRSATRARSAASGGSATSSPSPLAAASPYRRPTLWRVHAASSLLVVPQFATATFSAEYLVSGRHWDGSDAGRLLAAVAVVGALGRLGAGRWSDLAGSRLRPMRQVALLSAVTMVLVGVTVRGGSWLVLVALAVASVVSVSDNGLGFTATAELAGRAWSGRALGVQNTAQNLAAFATGPLIGALAGARGFALAFGACAVFPLLGAWATPVNAEHRDARHDAPAEQGA